MNATGGTTVTKTLKVTTTPTPIVAPTGITVTVQSNIELAINVTDASAKDTCGIYLYEYTAMVGPVVVDSTLSPAKMAFLNQGTNAQTEYTVSVVLTERTTGARSTAVRATATTSSTRPPFLESTNIAVDSVTRNSSKISWDPPAETTNLGRYRINYFMDASNMSTAYTNASTTQVELTSLAHCTRYYGTITAENNASPPVSGVVSRIFTFITDARADSGTATATHTSISGTISRFTYVLTSSVQDPCGKYVIRARLLSSTNALIKTFDVKGMSLVVSGLTASTSYKLESTILETVSDSRGSINTITFMTPAATEIAAPKQVMSMLTMSRTIQLTWMPPTVSETDQIMSYDVTYIDSLGETKTVNTASSAPRFELTSIEFCTTFDLMVRAKVQRNYTGNLVDGEYSDPITVRSSPATPAPVDSVQATILNQNSVRLTISDGNTRPVCGEYAYYAVAVRANNSIQDSSRITEIKSAVLENLMPNTEYKISVAVFEKISGVLSTATSLNSTLTTSQQASPCTDMSQVNFATSAISSSTISLSWSVPTLAQGITVQAYRIGYNEYSMTTSKTSYVLMNLHPCTKYTISLEVVASNNVTCSRIKPLVVQTFPSNPKSLAMVSVRSDVSNQIFVSLQPARTDETNICGQPVNRVVLFDGPNVKLIKHTRGSSLDISSQVEPTKNYTVSATTFYPALSIMSRSLSSSYFTSPNQTLVPPRPKAPENVTVTNAGPNSMVVTWTTNETSLNAFYITYTGNKTTDILAVASTERNATITGLNPCTSYDIYVQSIKTVDSKILLSDASQPTITQKTANGDLPKPQASSLYQVNATSMRILLPENTPAGDMCYQFQTNVQLYQVFPTSSRVFSRTIESATTTFVDVPGLTSSKTFTAPTGFVDVNTQMPGPLVRSPEVRLVSSTPEPALPMNVQMVLQDKTNINVTWTPVTGTVAGYLLSWSAPNSPVNMQQTNATADAFLITNLRFCTVYTVRIQTLAMATPPIAGSNFIQKEITTANQGQVRPDGVFLKQDSNTTAKLTVTGIRPQCPSMYEVILVSGMTTVFNSSYQIPPMQIGNLVANAQYTVTVSIIYQQTGMRGPSVTSDPIIIKVPFAPPQGRSQNFSMRTRILTPEGVDLDFSSDLNNSASPRFLSLQAQFCDAMRIFVGNSNQNVTLQSCMVNNFAAGSVFVNASMQLDQLNPTDPYANITSVIQDGVKNTAPSDLPLTIDSLNLRVDTTQARITPGGGGGSGSTSIVRKGLTEQIFSISLLLCFTHHLLF